MKRVKELLKNPDHDNRKDLRRVHPAKSFVLIGDEEEKMAIVINPRRHDDSYRVR